MDRQKDRQMKEKADKKNCFNSEGELKLPFKHQLMANKCNKK